MTEASAVNDPGIAFRTIPTAVSDYAGEVDKLYYALLGLSGLLIVILVALVVIFGWRYREDRSGERLPLLGKRTGHYVEIGFAVLLALLFLGIFAWGSQLYLALYGESRADMTINVVGKQWMWKIQHPDGTREINTLHVPAGETIRLRIISQDVIHSFSLPGLRLKRDAVPGQYTSAVFTPEKVGEYRLFCAEYCGTSHSRMRGKLVVLSSADYQAWLTRNGQGPGPVAAGRQLFQSYGCSGCHQGKASVRAPGLDGVYGRTVPLADGRTVKADEAYLRDSIMLPQKHVVAGYAPIMPSFSGQIGEGEILQIVAYLKSLEPGEWQTDNSTGARP